MEVLQIRGLKKASYGDEFAGCVYELENGDTISVSLKELQRIATTGEARRLIGRSDTFYIPIIALTNYIFMIEKFIREEGLLDGFEEGSKYIDNQYRTLTFVKYERFRKEYYFEYVDGRQYAPHTLILNKDELYALQVQPGSL